MLTCLKHLPAVSIHTVRCSPHRQQLDGLSLALLSPPSLLSQDSLCQALHTRSGSGTGDVQPMDVSGSSCAELPRNHPRFTHCLGFPGGESSGPCCTEDRCRPKYFGARRALASQKLQKEAKPCLGFHVHPCRKPAASRDNSSHPDETFPLHWG